MTPQAPPKKSWLGSSSFRDTGRNLQMLGPESTRPGKGKMPGTGCIPNTARQYPRIGGGICQAHGRQAAGGLAEETASRIACLGRKQKKDIWPQKGGLQALPGYSCGKRPAGNDRRIGGSFRARWGRKRLHQRRLTYQNIQWKLYFLWRAGIRHGRNHEWPGHSWRLSAYAGTFLSFTDQARNALRLTAMMKLHVITG